MTEATRTEHARLTRDQHRVLSLVDNSMSVLAGVAGDDKAFNGRMRTIWSLIDRGLLNEKERLTVKGRKALYWYRDRSATP